MRRIFLIILFNILPAFEAIYPVTEILEIRDNTFLVEIVEGDKTNASSVLAVAIKSYTGRNLSTEMCEQFPNMESYNANHLMLEAVEENALAPCKSLTTIRLSGNNLKKLAPNTFNQNPLLEIIEMHDNELDEIPVELFSGLVGLKELYLSNNNLVSIPTEAFRDTKSLYKITLNSNPLMDLDVEGLSDFLPLLTAVNIEDTDIKCSHMRKIVHLFSEKKIIFYIGVDRERGRTFVPAIFRGHKCLSNEQYDRELLLRRKIPEAIEKVQEMHSQMQELMKNVTKLMSLVKK